MDRGLVLMPDSGGPTLHDTTQYDLLWAAQVGELCGRAGGGLAPEWGFLDVWTELLRADDGCLVVVRPDGREESFGRGLAPLTDPARDGVTLLDGEPFGRTGQVLEVAATGPGRLRGVVLTGATDDATDAAVRRVLPLVQRALLRLANGPASTIDAAALKSWLSAPEPMLLLEEDLTVLAGNPAAHRRLGVAPGHALPPWLARWLENTLGSVDGRESASWTVRGKDAEYHLGVLSIGSGEPTPGRWLVSIVRGGPSLSRRIDVAAAAFGLTPREREALELLADGLSNRQIAAAIQVAEGTVKFHFVSVMRKAGVASRTELLARVHSLHLTDPDVRVPASAIRTRTGYVWQEPDGIVHCAHDVGTALALEDIQEFQATVSSFFDGTPLLVYSDATGVVSSTADANKAAGADQPHVGALGVKGGSAVSRALVNMWMRLSTPSHPTRLFRDRDAALAWLESHRP